MSRFKEKGFTLIEILVVISIISVLSSILITVTQEPRLKARDARRIQELQQLRRVLELYRSDHGRYPLSPPNPGGGNYGYWESSNPTDWEAFQNELQAYTPIIPVDPINSATNANCREPGWDGGLRRQCLQYRYGSSVDGSEYDLIAHLESNRNPSRCSIRQYRVHSDKLGAPYTNTVWCTLTAPTTDGTPYLYSDH